MFWHLSCASFLNHSPHTATWRGPGNTCTHDWLLEEGCPELRAPEHCTVVNKACLLFAPGEDTISIFLGYLPYEHPWKNSLGESQCLLLQDIQKYQRPGELSPNKTILFVKHEHNPSNKWSLCLKFECKCKSVRSICIVTESILKDWRLV